MHQAVIFSYSLVVLFLVWIAIFGAWRSYRVSALQERLGILHTRLFDLAALGDIPASADDVRQLQRLLEAAIRQAGMMTFARFQLASLALRWGLLKPLPGPGWTDRAELGHIHEQMRALIARHVIAGCPLLWIFINSSQHVRLIPGLTALDELLIGAD